MSPVRGTPNLLGTMPPYAQPLALLQSRASVPPDTITQMHGGTTDMYQAKGGEVGTTCHCCHVNRSTIHYLAYNKLQHHQFHSHDTFRVCALRKDSWHYQDALRAKKRSRTSNYYNDTLAWHFQNRSIQYLLYVQSKFIKGSSLIWSCLSPLPFTKLTNTFSDSFILLYDSTSMESAHAPTTAKRPRYKTVKNLNVN